MPMMIVVVIGRSVATTTAAQLFPFMYGNVAAIFAFF